MPLVELQPGIAVVRCVSCREVRRIATSRLVQGTEHDPNIIVLPPCRCGGREFLNRTIDTIDKRLVGTDFDKRRRLVNTLADQLVQSGRLVDRHRAWLADHQPTDLLEEAS